MGKAEQEKSSTPLDVALPFEKLGLQIGDTMYLESIDQVSKYPVKLVGYVPGQGVIVTAPRIDGKQIHIKQDKPFTIRALAKNQAFAFTSTVKATVMQPFAHIHLEYPRELMTVRVRNANRLRVELPTRISLIKDNQEIPLEEGVISDISKTGCGIRTMEDIGQEGDVFRLHFQIEVVGVSKSFKVAGIVRNRLRLADDDLPFRYSYGIQFHQLSEAAQIVLTCFVYEVQERA